MGFIIYRFLLFVTKLLIELSYIFKKIKFFNEVFYAEILN